MSIKELVNFWCAPERLNKKSLVEVWAKPKPETLFEKIARKNFRKPLQIPPLQKNQNT